MGVPPAVLANCGIIYGVATSQTRKPTPSQLNLEESCSFMAVIINWWLGGPVQPGIGFQNKH